MPNGTMIGVAALLCGYLIAHPTSAVPAKSKTQGAFQELAARNNVSTKEFASHIPARETRAGRNFGGLSQLAAATSNRCATPAVVCILPQPAPVGAPCWCATPYGPQNGVVK
jgi:hypothetical protein